MFTKLTLEEMKMKAYILTDAEFQTDELQRLESLVINYLCGRNFEISQKRIKRDELAYCKGCYGCWVKTPGECVINDGMAEINREFMASEAVVYLSPVVFGQFSANIKTAIDRWLPNMLPFFMTREDGSTIHPPRYESYPQVIIFGYGEGLSEEDAALFADITTGHRRNGEVLIYRGDDVKSMKELSRIELKRWKGGL